ncbi:hypothetical protein Tco_0296343, partial [Tanacetum coccineum]
QIQTLRIASTQALIDVVTAALPSPPLPPPPPSLYIPPPVDRRDDILESEQPPRKRSCLFSLGPRYEVEESSTARPTRGRGAVHSKLQTHREQVYAHESQLHAHQTQLQLQGTLIQTQHQIVETLCVMRDMRRDMGDMQAELLALQKQQRRSRQPGPDVRVPDHHDASRDADSHIYSHGDNQSNVQTTRPCFYANFMKCQPLNFKGNEGVVGLTQWIENMESVFNISGCAIENQEVLKKKMTDKYCPQGKIKKLEIELGNLKTLICTKFVANETQKVDKYISGLPDNIYGNVKSARPKTLDKTIELANELMD